jgi:synaptobrevin family protein YKT6
MINQDYVAHIYVRTDGLAGAIVVDAEYPQRVAFSVIAKTLDEFSVKFPRGQRNITVETTSQNYPHLKDHLVKAQDPQSSDPFMRVQKDLDDTKLILVL